MTRIAVPTSAGPIISVDDDERYHDLLSYAYRKSKLSREFLTLLSGDCCLGYLKRAQLGEVDVPALILIDINMPVMGGPALVSHIRAFPDERISAVAIAMLTSSSHGHDRQVSFEAGANAYYEKPMSIFDLTFEIW